jgi:hypothetical protein
MEDDDRSKILAADLHDADVVVESSLRPRSAVLLPFSLVALRYGVRRARVDGTLAHY